MKEIPASAQLIEAFHADDAVRVGELLARYPALAKRLSDPIPGGAFGAKPIGAAVERGNLAMIDVLLQHAADINGRSDWWAGSFGVLDICDPALAPALIERGATVDAHSAARLGKMATLAQLIDANPALVHARGGDGQTPLHFASTVEIATYLLDHGADIDARDVDHESTPAQWMLAERQEVARFLMTRGCRTDILMAAALGASDLVRHYLDHDPASVNTRVSAEYFPMHDKRAGGSIYTWTLGSGATAHVVAKKFGHDDIYEMLMSRSSEALQLSESLQVGDADRFRSLVARNPGWVQSLGAAERRQLVDATQRRNLPAVRLMLDAGWPLDVRGDVGGTALHHAAWLGDLDLVRMLVAAGAPVNIRGDHYNMTPLGYAHHGRENSWRKAEGDYAGVVAALESAGGT